MIRVRATAPEDVALWRALRRDGIKRYPSAFILSLAEHDAIPEAKDAKRLAGGDRFLAFIDDTPVGLAGLNQNPIPRAKHRAEIGPFYVTPTAQGTDTAKALIHALTEYAASIGVWQLELAVNEDNARAISFYKRHGFHQTGRMPNAILGADGPEHDLTMIKTLA
ncbi:MAG: GNAT family N-acetyltransferase [Aquaticitalea sp.]